MSYGQQGGYPGYPPQGPPPGQYGQHPYPPQSGGYPPPPPGQYQHGGPPPGQYQHGGPPPGQYQHGGPPPGQYQHGGPPPGQYQQGPPPGQYQQHPYPPQGQFQGGHGQPPAQQGYGQFPPQGNFPPAAPSPGYDLNAPLPAGDASRDAKALREAMKGFGTDNKTLIRILSKPDPNQMRLLVHAFNTGLGRNLENDIKSETSGDFEDALVALIRGPLAQDVYLLNKSLKGLGTKEDLLNEVLCCRSNADIRAIKTLYQKTYKKELIADVKSDLSGSTEKLFEMILSASRAEESAPYDPLAIDRDAMDLHRAMGGQIGTDEVTVSSILTSRNDSQIRGIIQVFQQKFHTSLAETIKKEFSGHMEDSLLLILNRASDPAMAAAELIEESMKGAGTDEDRLIQRVIRAHWDRSFCDQVKRAYKHKYKTDLHRRIEGETKGYLEGVLVACLE